MFRLVCAGSCSATRSILSSKHSAAVGRNRNKILCVLHAFQVLTRSARSTSVNSVLRPLAREDTEPPLKQAENLRASRRRRRLVLQWPDQLENGELLTMAEQAGFDVMGVARLSDWAIEPSRIEEPEGIPPSESCVPSTESRLWRVINRPCYDKT